MLKHAVCLVIYIFINYRSASCFSAQSTTYMTYNNDNRDMHMKSHQCYLGAIPKTWFIHRSYAAANAIQAMKNF